MKLREIFSFWNRRVKIPIKWDGVVLDIGSGDKPHWRADVLLENYPEEEFAVQRGSGGEAIVSAPMIIGDIQNLPFQDKSFDFVIASHVLEHVPDVAQACRELQRIAKSGYIELPYEGMAKILDLESHLWWCKKQGRKLIFNAKKDFIFDEEISKYVYQLEKRNNWFQKIVHPNFDLSTVQLWWKDQFDFEVKGEISEKLLQKIHTYELNQFRPVRTFAWRFRRFIIKFLQILFWHKTRKEEFDLVNLLQCPSCGRHKFNEISDFFECQKCKQRIVFKKS